MMTRLRSAGDCVSNRLCWYAGHLSARALGLPPFFGMVGKMRKRVISCVVAGALPVSQNLQKEFRSLARPSVMAASG